MAQERGSPVGCAQLWLPGGCRALHSERWSYSGSKQEQSINPIMSHQKRFRYGQLFWSCLPSFWWAPWWAVSFSTNECWPSKISTLIGGTLNSKTSHFQQWKLVKSPRSPCCPKMEQDRAKVQLWERSLNSQVIPWSVPRESSTPFWWEPTRASRLLTNRCTSKRLTSIDECWMSFVRFVM